MLRQVHAVVGVLSDDTDPMVTVMKLEKAPQETYADIGGRWNCSWAWFYEIYFPLVLWVLMLADNINFMCENVCTGTTKNNAKSLLYIDSKLF